MFLKLSNSSAANVKSDHRKARLRERNSDRQSYISKANDRDANIEIKSRV
jgi:hypothetical protein